METNDQKQFEIDGNMVSLDELIKGYSDNKITKRCRKQGS